MFGFKKALPADEFAIGVYQYSNEFIDSDMARSLVARFEDVDLSNGAIKFLEQRGVAEVVQMLYRRQYIHCILQTSFSQFASPLPRNMTHSVMSGFRGLDGYDFERTYNGLDAALRAAHKFSSDVEPLSNREAQTDFLPNANAGVLTAKYLIDASAIVQLRNRDAFVRDFKSFSTTVCSTLATVQRAVNSISSKFKLG